LGIRFKTKGGDTEVRKSCLWGRKLERGQRAFASRLTGEGGGRHTTILLWGVPAAGEEEARGTTKKRKESASLDPLINLISDHGGADKGKAGGRGRVKSGVDHWGGFGDTPYEPERKKKKNQGNSKTWSQKTTTEVNDLIGQRRGFGGVERA